jgi:hypothetical protein
MSKEGDFAIPCFDCNLAIKEEQKESTNLGISDS